MGGLSVQDRSPRSHRPVGVGEIGYTNRRDALEAVGLSEQDGDADSKIARLDYYNSKDQALKAAGLSE